MGEMLAMPTPDPIADECRSVYDDEGVFAEGGWLMIPRAVARELIPGEDFDEFMREMPPSDGPDVAIDLDRLEQIDRVEGRRRRVDVLVTPTVSVAAQRALAEYWTVDELIGAVKDIAEEFRPRVKRLVDKSQSWWELN